jgi:PhzF family phenazine biosynthesis protein
MRYRRFKQVDVFTSRPFYGNPVAVVLDAEDRSADEMQRIATWTNLSETTFVLPATAPESNYRLRIFCPTGELPFAGHPTVGSAHAALEAELLPAGTRAFHQEYAAGILPLTVAGEGSERQIFVQALEARLFEVPTGTAEQVATALGGDAAARQLITVDVGPRWLIVPFDDGESVRRLAPNQTLLAALSRELRITGVTVFARERDGDAAVRVRSFAPAAGVPEDPVCGSGNVSVAAYLAHAGLLAEVSADGCTYTACQGNEIGRDGRVQVRVAEGGRRIEIGGAAVTVVEGTILA